MSRGVVVRDGCGRCKANYDGVNAQAQQLYITTHGYYCCVVPKWIAFHAMSRQLPVIVIDFRLGARVNSNGLTHRTIASRMARIGIQIAFFHLALFGTRFVESYLSTEWNRTHRSK